MYTYINTNVCVCQQVIYAQHPKWITKTDVSKKKTFNSSIAPLGDNMD